MNNRTNKKLHERRKNWPMRLLCCLMAALLLLTILPAPAAQAATDGMIRVKLTKLGSGLSSITLKTSGGYACAGKTIASGSTVTVAQSGSGLTLSVNGQTVTSGSQIALNRLSGGLSSGVKFTSPSKSNTFHADLIFSVNGGIQTVARMYIETYLYGVVGYEMSNSYPIEALKTQAIAARTYALRAKKSSGSYDVTDNTNSQVFYGYSASQKNVISAVDATRGMCLMAGGSYAQCFYTASNGGQTESSANIWGGSVSYLVVKDDPYDLENPGSRVKSALIPKNGSVSAALSQALLDAADSQLTSAGLKSSGRKITGISEVTPHTPKYAAPSRVYTKLRFTLTATDGSKTAQATVNLATFGGVEDMLGLSINSSSNEIVSVEESGAAFTLSFRRYGHGVGMSQRGAQQMASAYGKSYRDILSFYYPGTTVATRSLGESLYGAGGEVIGGDTDPEETLSYGSSGEAVKELQRNLQALGFFEGSIGGNYLTLTEQAVKAYQTARGLTADGVATPELQKRIAQEAQGGEQPTPTPAPQYPLALIQMPKVNVRLNVRKGPGTGHKIVGRVTHGTQVEVLGASGSWSQIRTESLEGYVMTTYLKMIEATATPAPSETPALDGETLSYGSSGEAVKALQRRLKELGYFDGEIGGNYLAKTQEAVQAFQRANGLNPDGVATPELQKLIFGAQATATPTPESTAAPTQTPETGRTGIVTISGSRLNLREKASTSSKILTRLSGGTKVTVLGESGNWYHVNYNGTLGYLSRDYVRVTGEAPTAAPTNEPTAEPTPEPAPEPTQAPETGRTGVVNISGSRLNLREKASTSSKILTRLSGGTKVTVLGESGNWYHVNYNGTLGYLSKAYVRVTGDVSPTAAPTASPTQTPETGREATIQIENGGALHLRKGPGTDTESLGYVQNGDKATILGESGEWYRVRVDGKEGYLKKIYLDGGAQAPEATPAPTAAPTQAPEREATIHIENDGTLHLRKGPSTDTESLGYVQNGDKAAILGESGEWYRVRVDGKEGYLKKIYLVG